MKKVLTAVALLLLFSCSDKDSSVNFKSDIRFDVVSDQVTRGEVVTLSNLSSFSVSAVSDASIYFSDMKVSSSDGGASWSSKESYIWPSFPLDFYAYSRSNGTVVINSSSQKVENFTVSDDLSSQKDFVVATSSQQAGGPDSGKVPLKFYHATSSIVLKAYSVNEVYNITVYGIKIGNVRSTDNFTFPTGGDAPEGSNWQSWNVKQHSSASSHSYKILFDTPITLTDAVQTISSAERMFLIPQQRTGWKAVSAATNTPENQGSYISLLVNIKTAAGGLVYPKSASYKKDGVNAAWDAVGTNLTLTPGETTVLTLKFFGEGGAGQQDPDEPGEEGKGGDPILNGSMKIEVSVEPWTEGTSTNLNMK